MTECTTITVNSPAKINLTFEVLGLLLDGYHEVATLMQAVSLSDELTFEIAPAREPSLNISLSKNSGATFKAGSEQDQFPTGEGNLIARALRLFLSSIERPRPLKVDVTVVKNVPIGAGLAGGSGNAAAALVALNQYFAGPLDAGQMSDLAARLGADVPFCLKGGRQLGLGRGDMLVPVDSYQQLVERVNREINSEDRGENKGENKGDIKDNIKDNIKDKCEDEAEDKAEDKAEDRAEDKDRNRNKKEGDGEAEIMDNQDSEMDLHFVLAKTRHLSIATPWVYEGWDQKMASGEAMSLSEKVKDRGIDALPYDYAITNLLSGNLKEALRAFGNDFEQVVFPHYKQLKEIKQRFVAAGALASHMTGSGPTIYAVAESAEHAADLVREFRRREAADTSLVCATKFDQIDLYPVHSLKAGVRVVQVQKS